MIFGWPSRLREIVHVKNQKKWGFLLLNSVCEEKCLPGGDRSLRSPILYVRRRDAVTGGRRLANFFCRLREIENYNLMLNRALKSSYNVKCLRRPCGAKSFFITNPDPDPDPRRHLETLGTLIRKN